MKKLLTLLSALAVAASAYGLSVSEITDITPKVDEAPVPVKTPPPEYPEALKAQKISGTAVVTVVIDEKGEVIASEIKKSTHDGFGEPALAAVSHWKFSPAKLGGKAVKVRVAVPIRFAAD